jgi:phytoene dehydrogenase-like protein
MKTPDTYDALVIGGGVNGLTAAAYLARGGKRTLLVEARETLGGLCETADLGDGGLAPMVAHTLYALDPRVTSELRLTRYGLKFALRDATIALLKDATHHLVLPRDIRAAARNIAACSKADAEAWPRYHSALFALGRSMRALWWEAGGKPAPNRLIEQIARTGTGAWLDSWFESDPLKALLAFDASALSPLDAGSALLLAWRAAQEMCGLQASVAFPAGGPGALSLALAKACEAAAVEIRTSCGVAELVIDGDRNCGARLHTGDLVTAPLVLSSLSRRTTLVELARGAGLGLAEQSAAGDTPEIAAAKVLLALDTIPDGASLSGLLKGRLILAERLENYSAAHADARAGRIPDDLLMEVTFPTIADPSLGSKGRHIASVLVRPVPRDVAGGWEASKTAFAAKVVSRLNSRIPGLVDHVVAIDVLTPDVLHSRYGAEPDTVDVSRMMADWPARVETAIGGLYLCGADADVAPAVSGRPGRIAATLAIAAAGSR